MSSLSSSAAAAAVPRDAAHIADLLRAGGVTQYEPEVVSMLLEFSHRHVTEVLTDARDYGRHAGRSHITVGDVELAQRARVSVRGEFAPPVSRDALVAMAKARNQVPLPLLHDDAEHIALPAPEYCLTSPNFQVNAVASDLVPAVGRVGGGGAASATAVPSNGKF